jgi:hypothetical protein
VGIETFRKVKKGLLLDELAFQLFRRGYGTFLDVDHPFGLGFRTVRCDWEMWLEPGDPLHAHFRFSSTVEAIRNNQHLYVQPNHLYGADLVNEPRLTSSEPDQTYLGHVPVVSAHLRDSILHVVYIERSLMIGESATVSIEFETLSPPGATHDHGLTCDVDVPIEEINLTVHPYPSVRTYWRIERMLDSLKNRELNRTEITRDDNEPLRFNIPNPVMQRQFELAWVTEESS